jgi:hypothetical protein
MIEQMKQGLDSIESASIALGDLTYALNKVTSYVQTVSLSLRYDNVEYPRDYVQCMELVTRILEMNLRGNPQEATQ